MVNDYFGGGRGDARAWVETGLGFTGKIRRATERLFNSPPLAIPVAVRPGGVLVSHRGGR